MGLGVLLPVIVPEAITIIQDIIGLFNKTKAPHPTVPGATVPLTPDQTAAIQKAVFDAAKAALVQASLTGAIKAIPDDATLQALINVIYAAPGVIAAAPTVVVGSPTKLQLALATALVASLQGA